MKRFEGKEKLAKKKSKTIQKNDVWKAFSAAIEQIVNSLDKPIREVKESKNKSYTTEKEVEVFLDNDYYGQCPRCEMQFNYSELDEGKLVRCRSCHLPMRLKLGKK